MSGAARWLREALPLLALVAVVLPALLGRAGLESSLWMDEVHSLGMAELPPARIVDQAARDAHPPGYFLALSAWLGAGRWLGLEGLAWARGLGVLAWLALAVAVWALVRRLSGRRAAGPAVWAVAGGATAAQVAVELRGYFVVFAAAVVAFLVALVGEEEASAGRRRRAAAWWALYAALAAAALWTHLLAAPLFALIGATWLARVALQAGAGWTSSPPAAGGAMVPAGAPRDAAAAEKSPAPTAAGHGGLPGPAADAPRSAARRQARLRTRLALGLAAHLAAAVAWSPWLVRVPGQLATFSRLDTEWMTPATPGNLGLVFARWFPFGRAAAPEGWEVGLALLGGAAALVPVAGWWWSRAGGRRWGPISRRARSAAAAAEVSGSPASPAPPGGEREPAGAGRRSGCGRERAARPEWRGALRPLAALAVATVFPLLLWGLARFDLAAVFHGPRYPALAAGLWALAVAGFAVTAAGASAATSTAGPAAAGREPAGADAVASSPPSAGTGVTPRAVGGVPEPPDERRRPVRGPAGLGWQPWLLLAPWLLAAALGHLLALRQEARGGLPAARPAIEAALVSPDDPLYVSPSELAPFVRESLAGIALRPVEEVGCGLIERGRAAVLDLNPWPSLERSRDRIWRRAANRGLLAADWRWRELPAPALRANLLAMAGAGPEAAALCARSLAPPRPWTAAPAAVALPEDQLHADGWAAPELGRDLVPRRWATSPAATLRFDRPLPPGRHTLHLVAHRAPAPRPVEEVCVRPPGAAAESCSPQPAGRIEIALPFTLDRPLHHPRATVRHPLWSPAQSLGTSDRRHLTVKLEVAWIESEPPES